VNVWCGLLGNKLIGPFVFGSSLTGNMYELFLRNELPDLLEDIQLMVGGQMYCQHDGAPNTTTGMRDSTYINLSLTAGKVVPDPLHGYQGCQTLHLLITISGAT
jgi:hypothetical protein